MSSHPVPPQAKAALDQFRHALRTVEGIDLDPVTAPWDQLERAVIKLLGGAFDPQQPAHRSVALMVASAFAERLTRELGAFWFPNRGTPDGAALGFPHGVVVVSPVDVAVQALSRARLALLDDATKDLRGVIERARAANPAAAEGVLAPEDYRRLFDPGFVQFVCLDPAKAKAALDNTPDDTARSLEDAFARLPPEVPAELRDPMRAELVGALRRLDAGKPMRELVGRAPQLVELMALLHGAVAGTGFAQAELWQDVLLPLAHIGPADNFPAVDDDELGAWKSGADPLLVYVETLPYRIPATDEDGLLGVFPADDITLLDPCFAGLPAVRLVQTPPASAGEALTGFDARALRSSIERFRDGLAAQAGAEAPAAPAHDGPTLLDVSLSLLEDLSDVMTRVAGGAGVLCLRRATEAEASTEAGIDELRKALNGPRIILASG